MNVQPLLLGILGDYTEERIVRFIYARYVKRFGRIIYPKNAKAFRFPVYDYK